MGAGTVDRRSAPGLRDRHHERDALDRLLGDVRAGHSRVLVVRGEAGIGKTALLEYLRDRTSGCQIARSAGVESEMELAFASLQQLCAPLVGRLEHLPGPQRDALGTAFGLRDGQAPDRFLVELAVLGLLRSFAGLRLSGLGASYSRGHRGRDADPDRRPPGNRRQWPLPSTWSRP